MTHRCWMLPLACVLACGSPPAPTTTAPSDPPLDPTLTTLIVSGDGHGNQELWIDGHYFAPLVEQMRVQVTPGEHTLQARRAGTLCGETTIRGAAGQVGPAMLLFVDEPPPEPVAEPARAPGHVELPATGDDLAASGEGEFDPEAVRRMLVSRQHALDDCYQIARGVRADTGGAMTISMLVRERGEIGEVGLLDGTIGDDGDGCVRSVLEHMRFNPGPFGGDVNYTYTLRFVAEP